VIAINRPSADELNGGNAMQANASDAPAWLQAGAAILALVVTTGTYIVDASARRAERRARELAEMRLAAFDLLAQAGTWLEKVKEAQLTVPASFDWTKDPWANEMAGIVNPALDYGLHHIYPGGREIVPLKSTGADFYLAITRANGYLQLWTRYPIEVSSDEHRTRLHPRLRGWFAEIRAPLESAVDGMEKIVNTMLRKWE
jgi:hypothetical protein